LIYACSVNFAEINRAYLFFQAVSSYFHISADYISFQIFYLSELGFFGTLAPTLPQGDSR